MELKDEFEVSRPIEEAWEVLNDVERIAPCLPGAQLQEVEDDEYRGIVKVKVGPITAQYKGKATFLEQNEDDGRVVLKADGRDTRGAGNASAEITATLEPLGDDRTKVAVETDLTVTGKVAQFGRGVLADVSTKLMRQFADNLESMLEEPDKEEGGEEEEAPAEPAESPPTAAAAPSTGVRKIDHPEAEAIDLIEHAGAPVAKRIAPLVGVAVVILLLWWLVRRRRRS